MLQNAYFLAKIGADTAENERHFAEKLPKIDIYPTDPAPCAATASTVVGPVRDRQQSRSARWLAGHPQLLSVTGTPHPPPPPVSHEYW